VTCPSLIDPACLFAPVAGHAASAVTGGVLAGLAHAIQSGIAWVVSSTIDWWIGVPSADLAAEPAIGALQRWLLPVTVAVAVLAMLAAAGKMAITRKASPLIDVGSGLVIIAATSAVGVLLPALLVKAGDAWSSWVLAVSTGGQFGTRMTAVLAMPGAAPGVVIVLGVFAIVMAALQAVLMLFRQAAIVILAGVLPLAAAGTLAAATRAWFRRVTGWMLALIFYKPAAAAVYATAFTMIGRGRDPRTILMGFAMVLLSLLALPVLMKFFTWTTGAADSAAGGGFLGTMLSGAIAIGAIRGSAGGPGGSSAADQARLMSAQLGPQSGGRLAAAPSGAWPAAPSAGGPGSAGGPAGAGTGSGGGPAGAGAGPLGAPAGAEPGPSGSAASAGTRPSGAAGTAAGAPAAAGARAGSAAGWPAGGVMAAGPVAGGAAAGGGGGGGGSVVGAAGGAGGAAGAAAGPAGAAAAATATGAVQAGRRTADSMLPESEGG